MTDIDMIKRTGIVKNVGTHSQGPCEIKPFTQQPSVHRGKTKVLQENKTFCCLGKEATQTLRKLGYTELCVLNSCQKDFNMQLLLMLLNLPGAAIAPRED